MKVRVYVADGDAARVRLVHCERTDEGFEVETLVRGTAALENCRQQRPDLILVDRARANMDAMALCNRLDATPELENVPIVVIPLIGRGEPFLVAGESANDEAPALDPEEWVLIGVMVRAQLRESDLRIAG